MNSSSDKENVSNNVTETVLNRPLGPAWQTYLEVTARLTKQLETGLKNNFGLSFSDYNVMMLLSEADEGYLKMGELAKKLVFTPSRLTYQIGVLEKQNLVSRDKDPADGRSWNVCLTEEGQRLYRRASVAHAQQVRKLFTSHVSSEQLQMLLSVFTTIDGVLTEIENQA